MSSRFDRTFLLKVEVKSVNRPRILATVIALAVFLVQDRPNCANAQAGCPTQPIWLASLGGRTTGGKVNFTCPGSVAPCKAVGGKFTTRVNWALNKMSPEFDSQTPWFGTLANSTGFNRSSIIVWVKYRNTAGQVVSYSRFESGWYTLRSVSGTPAKQTIRGFCSHKYYSSTITEEEQPGGEFRQPWDPTDRTFSIPKWRQFSGYIILAKGDACRADPARCTGAPIPAPGGQNEWTWRCGVEPQKDIVMPDIGPIVWKVKVDGVPEVYKMESGLVGTDGNPANVADVLTERLQYYVAPTNMWTRYNVPESGAYWAHDYTIEDDGDLYRLYDDGGSSWKSCMQMSPCSNPKLACSTCTDPALFELGFHGISRALIGDGQNHGMSVGAIALQDKQVFKDALEASIQEVNSHGVRLFQAPNYSVGAAADLEVRTGFVGFSSKAQAESLCYENSSLLKLGTVCSGFQVSKARITISPCSTSTCLPGINQWTVQSLSRTIIHELMHIVLNPDHPDSSRYRQAPGSGLCSPQTRSVLCSHGRPSNMTQLTSEDINALKCVYNLP